MYKRQVFANGMTDQSARPETPAFMQYAVAYLGAAALYGGCLLYTSDAADERSSVDLGGRRFIKKKQLSYIVVGHTERANI